MSTFLVLAFFATICYLVVILFKRKPNKGKKIKKVGLIALVLFFAAGLTTPKDSPAKSKTESPTKIVYVGKKDYEKAKKQHSNLTAEKAKLEDKLDEIKQEEAEKKAELAAQQEAAAAKAQAEAKAKQEQARKLQEQQAAQQNTNPTPSKRTVFVAPNHGSKYHYTSTCRGLRRATSVTSMPESSAQAQGYTLCGWE